eukprot:m51a1_g2838 putative pas domain-containing protein tyrosine kinase (1160) ;mRNA; f:256716-261158
MFQQVWASIVLSALLAFTAHAAATGCSYTEPQATRSHPVVVVGFTSSSASTAGISSRAGLEAALREASDVSRLQFVPAWLDDHFSDVASANNTHRLGITGADGRVGVINVRAGGGDEMASIVSFLSRDYEQLRRTAVVTGSSSYSAYTSTFLNGTLAVVGVQPWAIVGDVPISVAEGDRAELAKSIVNRLLHVPRHMTGDAVGRPLAVVMTTTGGMTGPIIEEMAARDVANMTFVCASNVVPRDVFDQLSSTTRSRLRQLGFEIYFEQLVPPATADSELARDFIDAMYESGHDTRNAYAFEGYIVGRLLSVVAERALEIYGWPLTRQTFLDTVFRSYRTFDLRGVTFGPYGDAQAPQTSEDWCNQGAHELFTSQLSLDTGSLMAQSPTFKFAGCQVPRWSASKRALVGLALAHRGHTGELADYSLEGTRLGLSSALLAANSGRTANHHLMFAAAIGGTSTADNVKRLLASNVIAIAGVLREAVPEALQVLRSDDSDVPLIAPLSGSSQLRFPFRSNRNVINLVPLTQQELLVAVQYILATTGSRSTIGFVYGNDDLGSEYHLALDDVDALLHSKGTDVVFETSLYDTRYEMDNATVELVEDVDAFVFVGGTSAAAEFLELLYTDARQLNKTKVICSEVPEDHLHDELGYFAPSEVLTGVHLLSKTPPLSTLRKTNEVRQMYEEWVSDIDRGESSFRGFFVGMFLAAVIDAIDDEALATGEERPVTPELIVRTIYHVGIFDIGYISVGPFVDKCEGSVRCCNQGLDKVYISRWHAGAFHVVPFDTPLERCGAERTLSFLNIKRPDLEINECIAKGRCGPLHVGDWHGTTVAIKVIDKKAITNAELIAIKEEIGLLHKLHHPNLLMLMGYCETRNELYVVSEYMSGGSLKEYLARNRGQLGVFSLIAIAFDVIKGIAYLHASKPPIVHGSISTRSLLIDDKLTTKVSDFWLSHISMTRGTQHPEPDASTPKEVVELLNQCWEPQPDQRPTIFTVLRSWPSTFATVGRFELPSDLSPAHTASEDSGASVAGPGAVVPLAVMSHSEREAAQSLHFEFGAPPADGEAKQCHRGLPAAGRALVSSPASRTPHTLPWGPKLEGGCLGPGTCSTGAPQTVGMSTQTDAGTLVSRASQTGAQETPCGALLWVLCHPAQALWLALPDLS